MGWSPAPSLPTGFVPRWDFAYGYYPPADQVVVFGGAPAQLGQGWYNDTWLYSAGTWTKGPAAPAGLTARGGAAMAFDPVSNKLVLFGGGGGSEWPPRNDTWLWDGTRWTAGPAAPAGLAGRTGAEMVYDPDLSKIVLFGGSGLLPYTDVWFYNGASNTWSAGPVTPTSVAPRVFFGMTYDPTLHKILVAGGDGLSDIWYFDGTSWTPGPPIPTWVANYSRERTQFVYDPQIGGEILFSGIGPGYPQKSVFFLRGSDWTWVQEDPNQPAFTPPPARVEGAILFVPTKDAMMMFGGADAANDGTVALSDAWFFRDTPPSSPSVTLDSTTPLQTSAITLTVVPPDGGYYSNTRTIQWLKNDVVIPGATGLVLNPQYLPGDRIQAQVQYVDQLGVIGPWVSSAVAVVAQPAITVANGSPGTAVSTTGTGFGNAEVVDLHLDSPTGTVLKSITAWTDGSWGNGQTMPIPSPLVGGAHTIYAVGNTTGSTAVDPFTVLPTVSISPSTLAAGAATTVTANGFAAGELVSVSFPGATPVTVGASANGSATTSLVMPKEPYPGGNVSASAPSGSAQAAYTVKATMAAVGTPKPGAIALSLAGFGPSETVKFSLEGQTQSFTSASNGSLDPTVTLISTWGTHSLTATGMTSGVTLSLNVTFSATMTVNPASGPVGTVVTIDSGPGWSPGSTVSLSWSGAVRQTLTASSTGTVHTTYTIPTHSQGATTFKLYDSVLLATAKATFTVTKGGSVITVSNGAPGTAVATTGAGFGANELVDLHIDSQTGTILKTITASQNGSWGIGQTMPLPSPMVGGTHTVYAVGRTTGYMAQAGFQVLPAGSISPTKLAAGASTTFSGAGFLSGESVSVSFPSGGAPVFASADGNGSVSTSVVSPPEPYPGGVVTATGPSGTVTAAYTTASTLASTGTPVPGSIPLSLTGWGASESVTFTLEGQTQSFTTDSSGSLAPTVTIPTTYGTHDITATGASSGISMTITVTLLSPASITVADGAPGTAVATTGAGFGSGEPVDLRLDSQTGQLLKTITAWTNGSWGQGQTVPLPTPLPGGTHTMYAIGKTTGYVATAQFRVTPLIFLSPSKVAAGATTAVTGVGFASGENVAVAFPGGTAVTAKAGSDGSITASVVSPPEPYPSGILTASAPSGSATATFTVQSAIIETGTEAPASMPMSLTGWAPVETITFTMDGQSQSFVTDTAGSLTTTVTIPSTWGSHQITATGSVSGISMTDTLNFTATMSISPASGPVGTAVTIDSGPGWSPGSTVSLAWGGGVVQTLTADASGKVHTVYTIPAHDKGVVYLKLFDSVLSASVKQPFTIT